MHSMSVCKNASVCLGRCIQIIARTKLDNVNMEMEKIDVLGVPQNYSSLEKSKRSRCSAVWELVFLRYEPASITKFHANQRVITCCARV